MSRRLVWVVVRQALLGVIAVAASLPLLVALSRALGLGRPPWEGMEILAGSVVLGFAGGGLIGALLTGTAGGRVPLRTKFAAAALGLVWGGFLCSVALPLYTDSLMDDVTDAGTEQAIGRIGPLLERPSGAVGQITDIADHLLAAGTARLPALALLGWTLLGPALAAPLEARRPRQSAG